MSTIKPYLYLSCAVYAGIQLGTSFKVESSSHFTPKNGTGGLIPAVPGSIGYTLSSCVTGTSSYTLEITNVTCTRQAGYSCFISILRQPNSTGSYNLIGYMSTQEESCTSLTFPYSMTAELTETWANNDTVSVNLVCNQYYTSGTSLISGDPMNLVPLNSTSQLCTGP